ncbi:STAS domain-containing protein [Alkalicoccus daliensis]|uniref:RsbT co-antagonist protein RsbR n=1 Tax=Alkalicoccus daliensis TaxID=745820 RepID=A0A1H0IBL8_9BACI|nr:STAS domain-containing protein [Alkalicoccus daliensis]SDO28756.1 rsbT co-antagonist protein RsbR [Alkalicoccus daliensis]
MGSTKLLMQSIGEKINDLKEEIAQEISGDFQKAHGVNYAKMPEEKIQFHIVTLVSLFAEGFINGDVDHGREAVHNWGLEFGTEASELGLSAEKAMLVVPILRKVVYKYIRAEFKEGEQKFEQYYDLADTINPLIDQATYSFTEAYVNQNERIFQEAKEKIVELSVPVVPLTKEVAILPVIGSVDTKRSQELLSQALERGKELGLSTLIVDLSGVHMIDTYVAHNLFQLNDALRVTGIKVIFSGLRPEIAQTVVALGIRFDDMTVVSSLAQALKTSGLYVKGQT